MLLAARREAGLQRHGWISPLLWLTGGWGSLILVQREDELAKILAVIVLASWAWLCVQPSVRHKFDKINCRQVDKEAVNRVAQSIHQGILCFSVPFLVFATQTQAPGQVLVTLFVVLAALLSSVDSIYQKLVANQQLPFVMFHSLCSFIVSLIILPVVVNIPGEKSFTIALWLVLLWLVVGAPLNRRHHEISVRVFVMTLMFPLIVWSFKNHIPPTGILVESSVITSGMTEREPETTLRQVSLAQLKQGLYLYSSMKALPGKTREVIFAWRHGSYSDEMAATITGGNGDSYRTYALKNDFLPEALGHWSVDILTAERQLLDRVEFEVMPAPVYSSAFTVPRTELSMPRVTGLVIKPSM